MIVVPVSMLSSLDLCVLCNNLCPRQRPARRFSVAAVNRSLALHDEQIDRLYVGRRYRQVRKAA